MMYDDLELPEFLRRKTNGIATEEQANIRARAQKLVWPKKRNWRKIEERRRARDKAEGAAIAAGAIVKRKGQ
jgi:hypothetical protein